LPVPIQLKDIEKLEAEMGEPKANPAWLLALLAAEKTKATAFAEPAKPESTVAMKSDEKWAEKLDESVDSPEAKHPIHLLVLTNSDHLQATANQMLADHRLEVGPGMRLWVGGFTSAAGDLKNWFDTTEISTGSRDAGERVFREKRTSTDNKIVFAADHMSIERFINEGLRIVVSDDRRGRPGIYFELRVKTSNSNAPQIFEGREKIGINGTKDGKQLILHNEIPWIDRVRLVGIGKIKEKGAFSLGSRNERFRITPNALGGPWSVESNPPPAVEGERTVAEIKQYIRMKQADIHRCNDEISKEDSKRLAVAARSKELPRQLQAAEDALKKLKNELETAEVREQNLPHLFPESGDFDVFVQHLTDPESPIFPKIPLFTVELRIKEPSKPSPK